MTICIAALCNKGQAVVVAADRMMSAHYLAIEFDHPSEKIDRIGDRCVAMSAGDVMAVTDVLSEGSRVSGQSTDPPINLIAESLKERFVEVRAKRLNDRVFQPRGLSFSSYYGIANKLPSEIVMVLENEVQRFAIEVSMIVTGVDNTGGHIYSIDDPGSSQCFDRLGYHAIGSGQRHALLTLVMLQHNPRVSLGQAAFNVYSAKRQAEIAPGVGDATDMMIIDGDGIKTIPESVLKELYQVFANSFGKVPDLGQLHSKLVNGNGNAEEPERGDNGKSK